MKRAVPKARKSCCATSLPDSFRRRPLRHIPRLRRPGLGRGTVTLVPSKLSPQLFSQINLEGCLLRLGRKQRVKHPHRPEKVNEPQNNLAGSAPTLFNFTGIVHGQNKARNRHPCKRNQGSHLYLPYFVSKPANDFATSHPCRPDPKGAKLRRETGNRK